MKTPLLYLLPLLLFGMPALAANAGETRTSVAVGDRAWFATHVAALAQADRSPQQEVPSREDCPAQVESCLPDADLFVSSTEKFDSSYSESIVLHLVAKTLGKPLHVDLVEKNSGSPSLLRLNVMLQV